MALPYGTILRIDGNNTDSVAQSFIECLPATDSLVSCTVSVVSGNLELGSTAVGPWSSVSATASIDANRAIVWYRNAQMGSIQILFRGVSSAGRQIDLTESLLCETR